MMNYTTNVGERGLAMEETARLIASDKVEGTSLYDRKDNYIGRVHHLMVDKYSGQVAYAVASFGGFLGMGENFFPLPWKILNYDSRLAGYVVDTDRGKLGGPRASQRVTGRIGPIANIPDALTNTGYRLFDPVQPLT